MEPTKTLATLPSKNGWVFLSTSRKFPKNKLVFLEIKKLRKLLEKHLVLQNVFFLKI